jgi:hypothetical protein
MRVAKMTKNSDHILKFRTLYTPVGWELGDFFERWVGDVEALLVERQECERRRQLQGERETTLEQVGVQVGVDEELVVDGVQLLGQAIVGVPGPGVVAGAVVARQHHRQHDADHQRHHHGADAHDLHVVRRHPAHFSDMQKLLLKSMCSKFRDLNFNAVGCHIRESSTHKVFDVFALFVDNLLISKPSATIEI